MSNEQSQELVKIIWRPKQDRCLKKSPDRDWRTLGRHVRRLPQSMWEESMLFFGARDEILKGITGSFPATRVPGRTHPLFIERQKDILGHRICPCSSKSKKRRPYIHKGCVLEPTKRMIERKTYILSHLAFSLPLGQSWTSELTFMGLVPDYCIRRPNG